MFAPLFIVFLLFFLPSILLGIVSPYSIKLKARKLAKIGQTSGNLYAIATLGSVVGTFLATFVLILLMPINQIFVLLGAGLILIVFVLKKDIKFYVICIVILIMVFLTLSSFNGENLTITSSKEPTGRVLPGKNINDLNKLYQSPLFSGGAIFCQFYAFFAYLIPFYGD